MATKILCINFILAAVVIMKEYTVDIPTIEGFGIKYYYALGEKLYEPKIFPPHIHDVLEVYILVIGKVSFMVENSLYGLCAGDAIVSKPNEMHNCILREKSKHKHLCFWFDFSNDFIFSSLCKRDFGTNNLISLSGENMTILNGLIEKLDVASRENNDKDRFLFVLYLLRLLEKNMSCNNSQSFIPESLKMIIDDIYVNFAKISSIKYLATKYYVSQSTMDRLFKKYLHVSPKMYLDTKKLSYSRVLLRDGKSVNEACDQAGFSDYSNFIKLFKRRFGVTPKRYRDGRLC